MTFVYEDIPASSKEGYTSMTRNNQMSVLNETDLHESIVKFLRTQYPSILIIAGLGETQTTDAVRIACWRKGYCKGQPDLILPYKSGNFCGLAVELKTPAYHRETPFAQQAFLDNLRNAGWDVMVSNSYDEIIVKIVRYCDKVVAETRRRAASASSHATSDSSASKLKKTWTG